MRTDTRPHRRQRVGTRPTAVGTVGTLSGARRNPDANTVLTDQISGADDARLAARNGFQLGGSLMFTWVIGLTLTNVALPYLATPVEVGVLGFGEAVASIMLVVATFGLDVYIRKEVARRSDTAREFIMGTLLARAAASAMLMSATIAGLHLLGRDRASVEVVLWFGVATFLAQSADINAALLQAVGHVKGQARISVVAKVLWAAIAVGGLKAGYGVKSVPIAMACSEGLKGLVLGRQAHRVLRIPFSLRHQRVMPVLRTSLPFLATALAVRVMMWLDVTIMGVMLSDTRGKEATGLYFSAARLSQLALILAPVATWVLMPLASRTFQRSADEFGRLVRRTLQTGLTITIPLTALLALNADVVISVIQPPSYVPASRALRVLACMFVFTYLNILASTFLQIRGDGWVVVRATVATIVVDFVVLLVLVPIGHRSWGLGGAGLGAAIALIAAECMSSAILTARLGRQSFDRQSLRGVAAALYAVACVTVIDRVAARQGLFLVRTAVDIASLAAVLAILHVYDVPPAWRAKARAKLPF